MAQLYDSEKVREAARSVRVIQNGLEQDVTELSMRAIRQGEPLDGAAAKAMGERLELIYREIRQLGGEMRSISTALERYAITLEEVGEKLTEEML